MGTVNAQRKQPGYNSTGDDVGRGLLGLSTFGLSEYQPTGSNGQAVGNNAGRVLLAAASSGTSEIKTGGGQYGDETVADSLFPKTVNDAVDVQRTADRKSTDARSQLISDAANPGPAPDLADKLLSRAGAPSLMRQKAKQGRQSTFISEALGSW